MRASDLVEPYPTVGIDAAAMDAARLLAEQRLVGVIVLDHDGHPFAVLPGSQLLGGIVPGYVRADPTLARVVDERHADLMCAKLADQTVRDVLPADHRPLAVVDPDATTMEIAALMAASHTPLVAVVDDGEYQGAITTSGLLRRLLAVT
ncbi:CBS domain-containing protein [Thermocatellispora tengchongensis]|uniref:CBS domain-containing protein n=1 Tax=Thermocatellispora tengchongensis TaxID=1073253 RepID=A0A840PKB4_9ACTN|nr:CBS domain-containing protein [Thermocatellispora tengchongensis]MBB5139542.1 CBS domain-containing protein [Thermocatellispora tengchongensis]